MTNYHLQLVKIGQNARLAARLTKWKIDIKSESQFRKLLEYNEDEENVEDKNDKEGIEE